ncbi:xylulokinase [Muriicola soli]|uniref:Carbohydrate kinase n=1 Tax=Muriicola soli TaxID=2507538 RepID=A0A411EC01_9FLAO|nr:FGGY family carbohydrate kinase [Muriicola soli]QBA65064.1 carbohydrate kinase [Muriicola soli]
MYYLGIDIGSSFIKVALVETESGKVFGIHKEPETELPIESKKKGWAEQDPDIWWNHTCYAITTILDKFSVEKEDISGIGIAYQMHGLVVVDKNGLPLRKAIIWCDSRAVEIGETAVEDLGIEYCTSHLLNSPGNFTASKLKWIKENEPEIYKQIDKILLPGDYIASKITGKPATTIPGLTEGIFWDFKEKEISSALINSLGLKQHHFPLIVPTFGHQGEVSDTAAEVCNLAEGTPLLYRAGDQPNNALSLNVFYPDNMAMTGGTSAVVYYVSDKLKTKEIERLNTFAHVNYSSSQTFLGKLLCINGAGIQYKWLKNKLKIETYTEMNELAASIPIGSEGLLVFPFGNGAERVLHNQNPGSSFQHLDLNRHTAAHLCRATLEGICFALMYGIEILISEGSEIKVARAGNDNLFRSAVFSKTMCNLLGHPIEIYNTTGAVGAARACMIHQSGFESFSKAVQNNDLVNTFTPEKNTGPYIQAYQLWKMELELQLKH